MRIICCCLNAKYIHSSPAPWCLAAGVDSFCSNINIEIEVLESTINNDPYKIINEIVNKTPDIVTFSCYIWNITQTLLIAEKIKETLETKIVLGGPEVSYRSKDILYNYSFVDFVLSGEGEWCFSDLVNAINASGINIFDGRWLEKYLSIQILDYIINQKGVKKEETEIAVTVNQITDFSIEIIKILAKQYKKVTVVTNHIQKLRKLFLNNFI